MRATQRLGISGGIVSEKENYQRKATQRKVTALLSQLLALGEHSGAALHARDRRGEAPSS